MSAGDASPAVAGPGPTLRGDLRLPVGFGRLLSAELAFLLRVRWPVLLLLVAGSVALSAAGGNWFSTGYMVSEVFGLTTILPLIWASVIWTGERPIEREYFLAAPAGQGAHELARVAVGAALLLATMALCLLAQELRGLPVRPGSMGTVYVLGSLSGPLTLYLICSAVALVSAWPIAWYLGVFYGTGMLVSALGEHMTRMDILGYATYGLGRATTVVNPIPVARRGMGMQPFAGPWHAPSWEHWAPAAALWLTLALLALTLVAQRRRLAPRPDVARLTLE